jgi:glycerol-3-phosphate dehydrogenase subunit B
MTPESVVIGAGLAGLTAAVRLTEHGHHVVIVARGVGATHLAPATVDVLGYVGEERVDGPAASLQRLLERSPDHPYGRVTREKLEASLAWFCGRLARLGYVGSLEENLLLPTAIGVAKPSALVPRTMSGGDLRAGGRFVFVGFRGFKDFHPSLLADNLARARLPVPISARALELALPPDRLGDLSGRRLAERFDSNHYGDWLFDSLEGKLDADERVGVPAVLGLRKAEETWQELESRLERRVFEVPTLPPSIPGMRLFDSMTAALRAAGVRLVLGTTAAGATTRDGDIEAVLVTNASGTVSYPAQSVVLASGGFASGGLEIDSRGSTRETVFDLPLIGIPDGGRARFAPGYFDDQPLAGAGVAVDDRLRPVDAHGTPVYGNLHAAGAIIGGAVPWKEKSGTGISVATGYAAADAIGAASVTPTVAEPVR